VSEEINKQNESVTDTLRSENDLPPPESAEDAFYCLPIIGQIEAVAALK